MITKLKPIQDHTLAGYGTAGLKYKESRTNKQGNQVDYYYDGSMDRCRYRWDGHSDDGWLQFDTDQDAEYFGVWVNKGLMSIWSYAEGDFSVVTCFDAAHFDAEIVGMCKCYGVAPFVKTIDKDGTLTKYFEDREVFFIGKPPSEGSYCVEDINRS